MVCLNIVSVFLMIWKVILFLFFWRVFNLNLVKLWFLFILCINLRKIVIVLMLRLWKICVFVCWILIWKKCFLIVFVCFMVVLKFLLVNKCVFFWWFLLICCGCGKFGVVGINVCLLEIYLYIFVGLIGCVFLLFGIFLFGENFYGYDLCMFCSYFDYYDFFVVIVMCICGFVGLLVWWYCCLGCCYFCFVVGC